MLNDVKIVLISPQEGYLDIEKNSEVPFTFAVGDIKDITAKKSTFSKSIKLSGTKNNNILLNSYFNVNILEGTFNINKLQKVQVLRNGVTILEDGYLQLLSVTKSQRTPNTEQLVEYNVLIKDSVSDLYSKINNKELTDLEFGEYDHILTANNVINTFTNDVTDGYKYFIPYSTSYSNYTLNQFKPSIYAKTYFDKILNGAGFEYTWSTLTADTVQFDKLIIPYNGDDLKVTQEYIDTVKVVAENTVQSAYTSATTIVYTNEVIDGLNLFNPSTGIYTNNFYIDSNNNLTFTYDVEFEVVLDNNSLSAATLVDMTSNPLQISKVNYVPALSLFKNSGGFAIDNVMLSTINSQFKKVEGNVIPTGTTSFGTFTKSVTLASNSALPLDVFKTKCALLVQQQNSFNQGEWKIGTTPSSPAANVTAKVIIKNIIVTIQPNLQSISYNSILRMNDIVPKKIKQSDFLKSVMTMYNLFVEIDQSQPNLLIFKHRDDYYDEGREVDWTRKLAKNKEQLITFLPQLSTKKLLMTYKHDDNDVMLKGYKDAVNEIYGQVEYTFDSEYVKGTETKELIFSPITVGVGPSGDVLPFINGIAPKNNIKIALNAKQYTSANSITIRNYPNSSVTTTTVPLVSHWDAKENPSFDINFALNDYYFYGSYGSKTNNNLYNLHWRRTINQINKGKMLTAYFKLTERDINQLKLNQKIFINDAWWNINQIIDYKAGKNELTKVELLSIDDSIKFAPFKTRRTRKPVKGDVVRNPIKDFNTIISSSTNAVITESPVIIRGTNNFVGDNVLDGIILGDGNLISSNKTMTLGNDNIVLSDGIVFGNNSFVSPDTTGVVIFGDDITGDTSNTMYANNIIISSGGTINGVPISGITGGGVPTLSEVLATGNTTGGNDIIVSSGDVIKDSSGNSNILLEDGYSEINSTGINGVSTNLQIDTLFIDPQVLNNGTGFQAFDTITANQSQLYVRSNDVNISTTDNASTITDTISVDPQGLTNGTGIKSQDTTTGEYSLTQYGPNYISNYIADGVTLETSQINMFLDKVNLYSSTGFIASTSYLDVEPTIITIDSPNINIPTLPTGTPVNNVGIDAGGNLVVGTTGGGSTFTGGTITGPTTFINGLTATTISATTYQNLPTDIRITGGTYNNPTGTATFTNNVGGNFAVTGFITGNTDTYVTGLTYSNNIVTISQNEGQSNLSATINTMTGLTVNGTIDIKDINQNYSSAVQTTNGTITTIKTIPTVSEYVYQIEVNVVAGQSNTNKGITGKFITSFKNNGGTVTKIGDEFSILNSDFTTADITIAISGTNILVQVTGEAITTIDWGCSIVLHKMPMGVI